MAVGPAPGRQVVDRQPRGSVIGSHPGTSLCHPRTNRPRDQAADQAADHRRRTKGTSRWNGGRRRLDQHRPSVIDKRGWITMGRRCDRQMDVAWMTKIRDVGQGTLYTIRCLHSDL